jgi:hypothetical protein
MEFFIEAIFAGAKQYLLLLMEANGDKTSILKLRGITLVIFCGLDF